MKILLKVVLLLVVLVATVAAASVGYLYTNYPDVPPAESVTVVATPDKIAHGEYLSRHVSACIECHAERDFTK